MVNKFYSYFPLFLFLSVWTLVIFFTTARWYNAYTVSTDTWVLLFIGLYAFITGYLIFALYDRSFTKLDFAIKPITIDEERIALTLIILFIISCLGSFLVMKTLGDYVGDGFSTYTNKPISIRRAYVEIQSNPLIPAPLSYKLGSYLINICFVANMLGGALLTSPKKIKWVGLLPFIASVLYSISIFGRFALITSIAFYFISFVIVSFYKEHNERLRLLRNISIAGLIMVLCLYYLFYYIVLARYSLGLDLQEYFNKTIYFYFSGGIPALNDFLNSDIKHSYGTSSFRSVLKWLARFGIWPEEDVYSSYDKFTKVSPTISINTYTYIRSLYIDFGLLGVISFSFAWGAGLKIVLKKVYQNFSALKLYILIILIFSSLMTFYSFYFESISVVFFWMLPLLIFRKHFNKCFNIT